MHIKWIHGGVAQSLDLDGSVGDFKVEWQHAPAGGVSGVSCTRGAHRVEYVWRSGAFSTAP